MAVEGSPPRPPLSAGFVGIIVFKYVKCAACLLLGIAALRIAHLPHGSAPMEIARFLGGHLNRLLSSLLSAVTPGQVEAIGAATILAALTFAAEGTCLLLRLWWAPYFTIVLTALLLPIELVEIAKRPGHPPRYVLLAVNVAILAYLWKRRNSFRTRPG